MEGLEKIEGETEATKGDTVLYMDEIFKETMQLRKSLTVMESLYFKLKQSTEKALLKDKIEQTKEMIRQKELEYDALTS